MPNRLPLTDEDGEVRELTEEDFRNAVPCSDISESLRAKLSALKLHRPRKTSDKTKITIRLSREVVDVFRAMGNSWQTRMDEVLKEWIKTHPSA